MANSPQVSVVMSVYNGSERLRDTLDSVLMQAKVDFEFIIIDDGSRDGSPAILDEYAAGDSRIRLVHQANSGLTRALISGCAMARGEYIARQDAGGDRSLPERLQRQVQVLESDPAAVMVSCGTRFLGPAGELLNEVRQTREDLKSGLENLSLAGIRGPSHHGSTLFKRAAYEAAGGYRPQFRVAQDLDLWLRLAEGGACCAMPEILYEARFEADSISGVRRGEQLESARLAIDCAGLRRAGQSDDGLLESAPNGSIASGAVSGLSRARAYYFLASQLRGRDAASARTYYRKALAEFPLHLKALLGLLVTR